MIGTDNLWEPPWGFVVVERRWKYAPPPWVMYEAVVDQNDGWLRLLPEEGPALIGITRRPDRVLFATWPTRSITALEILIESSGDGSELTVRAYSDRTELPEDDHQVLRHRIGELFGAALRQWVDQPHG